MRIVRQGILFLSDDGDRGLFSGIPFLGRMGYYAGCLRPRSGMPSTPASDQGPAEFWGGAFSTSFPPGQDETR